MRFRGKAWICLLEARYEHGGGEDSGISRCSVPVAMYIDLLE